MDFERDRPGGLDSHGAPESLLLGPGRPHELERLLRGQDPSRQVLCISDHVELLQHGSGRALLDGALIPAEDLGILQRALQAGSVDLTLMGGDPSDGPLRQLLKHPRARWLPYPPDSEELCQLVGQVAPNPPPHTPAPVATVVEAPAPDLAPAEDPILAEIEGVLGQPVIALQTTEAPLRTAEPLPTPKGAEPPAPPPPEEHTREAPRDEEPKPAPAPEPVLPPEATRTAQVSEPAWFKDQVADLADIVQTIYASTSAIKMDSGDGAPGGLYADAMRLVQFTRTLGYLASPPPRGDTEIDLSELCEELLRSAGAVADAPRFLMRTAEPLTVRANKELIVQALDAILVLARLCAGPEGEVRLSGTRAENDRINIRLSFPSGPLGDLRPDEIVVPYALRNTLPDMGRNALRAAARIIEGQEGSLELTQVGPGELCFRLSLPGA